MSRVPSSGHSDINRRREPRPSGRCTTRDFPAIQTTCWPPNKCGMVSVAWYRWSGMGDADTAGQVYERTRVFTLVVSLGSVESLIEHPAG